MGCNCNKKPNINLCGDNNKIKCGCTNPIDSKCVNYTSTNLDNIGVETGNNIEYILKKINDLIGSIRHEIVNSLIRIFINVGKGKELYKGQNINGIDEFRTLDTNESINLIQNDETLYFKVDEDWFNSKVENNIDESLGIWSNI